MTSERGKTLEMVGEYAAIGMLEGIKNLHNSNITA